MPRGYVVSYDAHVHAHLVRPDRDGRFARYIDLFMDGGFEGTDITHETLVGEYVTWDDESTFLTIARTVRIDAPTP